MNYYCHQCGTHVSGNNLVWLELNNGTWSKKEGPLFTSQGWFPFCRTDAQQKLAEETKVKRSSDMQIKPFLLRFVLPALIILAGAMLVLYFMGGALLAIIPLMPFFMLAWFYGYFQGRLDGMQALARSTDELMRRIKANRGE